MPKFYAKIIAPVRTGRIYTETGSKYFEIWYDDGTSTTHYGDPEQYIEKVLKRAKQLNEKVVIER